MVFNKRLIELMQEHNISAKDLAHQTEINLSMLYKYLRGEYLPSLENTIKFANLFSCSIDYLVGNIDIENNCAFLTPPLFSDRLKKIMEDKKLTRYRLICDTKISAQTIFDWLNGKRLPSLASLVILSKYFDYSIDYIIGREN